MPTAHYCSPFPRTSLSPLLCVCVQASRLLSRGPTSLTLSTWYSHVQVPSHSRLLPASGLSHGQLVRYGTLDFTAGYNLRRGQLGLMLLPCSPQPSNNSSAVPVITLAITYLNQDRFYMVANEDGNDSGLSNSAPQGVSSSSPAAGLAVK